MVIITKENREDGDNSFLPMKIVFLLRNITSTNECYMNDYFKLMTLTFRNKTNVN